MPWLLLLEGKCAALYLKPKESNLVERVVVFIFLSVPQ